MTIKTALEIAAELVRQSNRPDKAEVIEALSLCRDTLHTMKWTKELIFDACDQFVLEHQRNITTRDFDRKGLPRHPTVERIFHMTAAEFRDRYYPLAPTTRTVMSPYGDLSQEEVARRFVKEFHRIRASSAEDFDHRRRKSASPCWLTVARICGLPDRWSALLNHLGLETYPKVKRAREQTKFSVSSNSALIEKVRKTNQQE